MKNRTFWLGFVFTFIISLVFFQDSLRNIAKPLSLLHGDAFLVNFIFKHYMDVFLSGQWGNLTTLPMLYGFKDSLFFTDHHAIHAALAFPLYLISKDIFVTSNLYIFFTMATSMLAMYVLTWHFTKSILPSMFAAIVWVCNPFVMARFPDQLILLSLQWIPLAFLFFERFLEKKKGSDGFFFFFFLTCQLLSSLYYSVFLSVILPLYVVVRVRQERVSPRSFFKKGVVLGAVLFLVVAGISGYLYYRVYSVFPINRSLEAIVPTYSAWPSDYFFAPPNNLIYGELKEKTQEVFPDFVRYGIYSEHNLFWGIIPLVIFILSFFFLPRSKYRKLWLISLLLMAFSMLLSFGPNIYLSQHLSIPGPYRIVYFIDPFFIFLRTASRFGVFAFFFLSLISAMTLAVITQKVSRNKGIVIGAALLILVLFEYWNKPLAFYQSDLETERFYETLSQRKDIDVVLDLPIGNLIPYTFPQSRAEDLDAHYLLYAAMYHRKNLFNGYIGFLPQRYYERAGILSINFPTNQKLIELRRWGVDGIILHREEFNDKGEYDRIKKALEAKKLPILNETANKILFDATGLQP